jgi:hypothetical protein
MASRRKSQPPKRLRALTFAELRATGEKMLAAANQARQNGDTVIDLSKVLDPTLAQEVQRDAQFLLPVRYLACPMREKRRIVVERA